MCWEQPWRTCVPLCTQNDTPGEVGGRLSAQARPTERERIRGVGLWLPYLGDGGTCPTPPHPALLTPPPPNQTRASGPEAPPGSWPWEGL